MSTVRVNDDYGSYICEYGHLHDYNKINLKKLEKEAKNNKSYDNFEDLMKDLDEE